MDGSRDLEKRVLKLERACVADFGKPAGLSRLYWTVEVGCVGGAKCPPLGHSRTFQGMMAVRVIQTD